MSTGVYVLPYGWGTYRLIQGEENKKKKDEMILFELARLIPGFQHQEEIW